MFTKQCGHIISFNNFARFESPGFLQASAALPEASSLDSAGDQAPVVSSNGFFLFLIDSLAVWSANRRAVVIAVAARPMHTQPASFPLPVLAQPNVQTQLQPAPLTPAQYIAAALQLPR